MPTRKEQVDEIMDALKERVQWENELARGQAQRKCMDRAKVNNHPWPRASNTRYPLSDTLIAQFTPFLFKILYSSERVAFFRALSSQNATSQGLIADWFDFKIKNDTDLEEIIQHCIDKLLQDGETVIKIMWNDKIECFKFEFIDNLFFVTPSTTLKLEDAPWCVHVLQKSKEWILKRFKDVQGIEAFVDRVANSTTAINDQGQREENEYMREGISITPKNKNIVIWEKHYKVEGGLPRITFLSPDDPDFDFNTDVEYEHDIGGYAFEHTKWEKIDNKLHSSRGIPRLVMEGEFTLTAIERSKQNAMTLYNTPLISAQGNIPANTQNISWQSGTFLPFPVTVTQMGEPPISWDLEARNQREKWERRVGAPDYGIGQGNTNNDSRTATEVKSIAFQQSQSVDLITGNWRMFLGKTFKKAWRHVVEANKAKPIKSLEFYLGGQNRVISPEILNNEWQITITGSAESVNRETMTQKAITLWQMCQNNPFANVGEAWKNVLQNLIPGEVDRFYQDPQARQQEQSKKTASDISVIIAAGFPMVPDPTDDLLTAGTTAAQFLQGAAQKGQQINPQQINLISAYIAACREGLKQNDKQGYMQLMQVLNQMDAQSQQQALQQRQQVGQQQPPQPQSPPQQSQPQLAQSNSPVLPATVPHGKKDIRKSITLLRNVDGSLRGARVIGIETDETGVEGPQVERKNIVFNKNPDGRVVGAQVIGTEA